MDPSNPHTVVSSIIAYTNRLTPLLEKNIKTYYKSSSPHPSLSYEELLLALDRVFSRMTYRELSDVLDHLISSINIRVLPFFLEKLLIFYRKKHEKECPIVEEKKEPIRERAEEYNKQCSTTYLIALYFLRSKKPFLQSYGVKFILAMNQAYYTPDIIEFLFCSYEPLQYLTLQYIKKFPKESESILERYLHSRSPVKQKIAAKILKKISPHNQKLALFLLEAGDFVEKYQAIEVLGESGNRSFIKKITPYLEDCDISVRRMAIEAIGKLGGRKAKQILLDYYEREEYEPLRKIVLDTLRRM